MDRDHKDPTPLRGTADQDVLIRPEIRTNKARRTMLVTSIGAAAVALVAGSWLLGWVHSESAISRKGVRISTVSRGAFVRDIAAEGTVLVANSPTLVAVAAGTVTFAVVAGQRVTAGQVVATIDSPGLTNELAREKTTLEGLRDSVNRFQIESNREREEDKQALELAAARVRASERELERSKSGLEQGVVAQRDLDRAQDERDDARLNYDHAVINSSLRTETLSYDLKIKKADLERQHLLVSEISRRVDGLNVRAPVAGIVGTLLAGQRAAVAENTGLLSIIDLSALEIEFRVPESYATELAVGMEVDVGYGGVHYPGRLSAVSPEIRQNEARGSVRFEGAGPANMRQNQRVDVRIILKRLDNVLHVERGDVSEGDSYAYVVQGDVAVRRPVKFGAKSIGEVEIVSGLEVGDRVIVSNTSEYGGAREIRLTR